MNTAMNQNKLWWLILFIFLLSGCTMTNKKPLTSKLIVEPSLWIMNLSLDNEEKFSGLLALQKVNDTLHIALLDTTGIKFLEGIVNSSGEIEVISGLEIIKKMGLPEYLAKMIEKIFLTIPKSYPCSWQGLVRICEQENKPGTRIKDASLGPFELWSVAYSTDDVHIKQAVFSMWWQDLEMKLEILEQ
jgi:hypothetical protein